MRSLISIRNLVLALVLSAMPATSFAGIFVSVAIAPPPLPVYAQPVCPGYGYMWTPGYWAYGPAGYFWVPGVWVMPPRVGLLWTPGYWGWGGGLYLWHAGYWGPHVGFYGGINYGFGYTGVGFAGGYWSGNNFFYNRAVMNVDDRFIHNTYNRTVINNTTVVNNYNRVSYNGGAGGVNMRPTPQEQRFSQERHFEPTTMQMAHQQMAAQDRSQLASVNHGRPAMLAMSRPMDRPMGMNRSADRQLQTSPMSRSANRSANAPMSRPMDRYGMRGGMQQGRPAYRMQQPNYRQEGQNYRQQGQNYRSQGPGYRQAARNQQWRGDARPMDARGYREGGNRGARW